MAHSKRVAHDDLIEGKNPFSMESYPNSSKNFYQIYTHSSEVVESAKVKEAHNIIQMKFFIFFCMNSNFFY